MRHASSRPGSQWPFRVLALALVLGGGAVTVSPVIETFGNNRLGSADTAAYVEAIERASTSEPTRLSATLERARAYNAELQPGALYDPWGDEDPVRSPAHDAYLTQLADFDALARIRIPQISVDLPVYHDATNVPLAKGAGHMYGTSLPIGGTDTHAVIAAHTGMKSRTMFDRLPEVKPDQTFFVDVAGITLTYRVDQIRVVEPSELEAVARIPGSDHITLVTCYTPPGQHKQRMLVRGVRVPTSPAAVSPASATSFRAAPVTADLTLQEWMWPRIGATGGAAVLAAGMGVVWARADRRRSPSPRHAYRAKRMA